MMQVRQQRPVRALRYRPCSFCGVKPPGTLRTSSWPLRCSLTWRTTWATPAGMSIAATTWSACSIPGEKQRNHVGCGVEFTPCCMWSHDSLHGMCVCAAVHTARHICYTKRFQAQASSEISFISTWKVCLKVAQPCDVTEDCGSCTHAGSRTTSRWTSCLASGMSSGSQKPLQRPFWTPAQRPSWLLSSASSATLSCMRWR